MELLHALTGVDQKGFTTMCYSVILVFSIFRSFSDPRNNLGCFADPRNNLVIPRKNLGCFTDPRKNHSGGRRALIQRMLFNGYFESCRGNSILFSVCLSIRCLADVRFPDLPVLYYLRCHHEQKTGTQIERRDIYCHESSRPEDILLLS